MPVIEGAREGLALLRERAHIIIATNTPKEGEAARIAWLNRNFGRGLEFVNTWGRGKGCVKADTLVDDYIPNIKDFTARNHAPSGYSSASRGTAPTSMNSQNSSGTAVFTLRKTGTRFYNMQLPGKLGKDSSGKVSS
jgi:hypothetical protein